MKKERMVSLGNIVATPGALEALDMEAILNVLERHMNGDWGVVCKEDWKTNDEALEHGGRIISAYPIDPKKECKGYGENCIWVITEADRSITTILKPDEY